MTEYRGHPFLDAPDEKEFDLGLSHFARFTIWDPDWDIQSDEWKEKYKDVPRPVERSSLLIRHPLTREDGSVVNCMGACTLKHKGSTELVNVLLENQPNLPVWDVHNLAIAELHIEPSVLCECGDHGFIRGGKWVAA